MFKFIFWLIKMAILLSVFVFIAKAAIFLLLGVVAIAGLAIFLGLLFAFLCVAGLIKVILCIF